jgi:hypothetical protein
MSYDLMVFDKDSAPRKRDEFIAWYEEQMEGSEGGTLENISPKLKNWFLDMNKVFQDENDSKAEGSNMADYVIGKSNIYVGFAWSASELARKKAVELAEKNEVGFFDVSEKNGVILFPENGKLKSIEE